MSDPAVFISYAHEDQEVARLIAAGLVHRGCKVWIDEGELKAGDSVIERIAEGVGETDFVAALISQHSVESTWCRKEIALAMTGELQDDEIPKVLPLRLGDVEIPPALADKFWLRVDTDRPEGAIQRLYQDILGHSQARANRASVSTEDQMETAPQPAVASPEPVPRHAPSPASAHSVRAELIGYLSDGDGIRADELLRSERHAFADLAREQIDAAESVSPGPSIDFDRFRELEVELVGSLERRFATLFPLVQHGTPELVRDELRWLARMAGSNWGRSGASYSAWTDSPRWVVTVLAYSMGAVACATGRFAVVRELWETPSPDAGRPLPTMRLLGADDFSRALEQARFGKRLALGPFWHTASILAGSDVCIEHYPELGPVLERSLHHLADFSWLVSALAGRDGLDAIHWWTGVGHYAGDAATTDLANELVQDTRLRDRVSSDVFGRTSGSDVNEVVQWASSATGPRPV